MDSLQAQQEQAGLDFSAAAEGQSAYSLARIQVAPLIDTVLFLIWFYLIVGQLVMHQKDASVQLPEMASPLSAREEPAEVIVNLRGDGAITIGGQALKPEQLAAVLAGEQAKARRGNQPLRVVLRADRRQQVRAVADILQRCRQAGLSQVVFRAQEVGS